VLRDPAVRAYVAKCFRAIAEEFNFWIDELAVEHDHVHVFLEFPPKYAIARVVGILKSISASRTFDRFPELRRKFWSGELWEDGYAARTVGDRVTSDLIRRDHQAAHRRPGHQAAEALLSDGCRSPALWAGRVTGTAEKSRTSSEDFDFQATRRIDQNLPGR
jgi:putative transposase